VHPTVAPPVRPSAWWYAATIGIGFVGLLVAVGLLVNGFRGLQRTGREVTTVALGSSGPVTFEEPDSFTLYYAGPIVVRSGADMRAMEAELDATLRPEGGGPAVPMRPFEGTSGIFNDAQNGSQAVALRTFTIRRAGTYTLTVGTVAGVSGDRGNVIVGKSVYAPLARGALWAAGVAAVAGVLALVATIALAVTRGRAKRQRRPPWPGGPPPWPGAPPPWPGPPPPGAWPPAVAGTGPAPGWPVPPPPPGYGPAEDLRR